MKNFWKIKSNISKEEKLRELCSDISAVKEITNDGLTSFYDLGDFQDAERFEWKVNELIEDALFESSVNIDIYPNDDDEDIWIGELTVTELKDDEDEKILTLLQDIDTV